MKKVIVSEEYINDFTALKLYLKDIGSERIFNALNTISANPETYSTLWSLLFDDYPQKMEENQQTFVRLWVGDIYAEKKEQYYLVWVKNTRTEDGFGQFMFVEDRYPAAISTSYSTRLDELKKDPNYLFSKDDAFKLRDTGFFEIKKVDE